MARTYNTLVIEVKEAISDIITAKQDDTQSRYLDVYLQDDGQPINLTGNEVRIYGRKKDGTEFFNDGQITEPTKGRCQFELTNQALAVVGKVEVEISIWQNNERILTTQTFDIEVMPKIRNDNAVESSNEFGALVVLFQKLYDFWLDMEEILGKTDDTGGSQTQGSVMAKLNALFSASGASGLKVKSVQRGFASTYSSREHYDYREIKIATVDLSKTIFITDTAGGFYGSRDGVNITIPFLIKVDEEVKIRQVLSFTDINSTNGQTTYKSPMFNWSVVEFY